MEYLHDMNNAQNATPPMGFDKLHLTSEQPEHSLEAVFARAFNEERLCTMTIKTSQETIPVHKSVIYLTSPVIAKAMDGPFLESRENCFDLSHEDPETVSRFIQFCYMSRYDTGERTQLSEIEQALTKDEDGILQCIGNDTVQGPNSTALGRGPGRGDLFPNGSLLSSTGWSRDAQESAKSSALALNAKRLRLDISMWAMGEIYDIQHLKSYAVSQLNARLTGLWHHGGSPSLILDIIQPVYECTTSFNDDLRIMLVQALRRLKKAIGGDPLLRSHFEGLAESNKDLVADLVDDWLDAP